MSTLKISLFGGFRAQFDSGEKLQVSTKKAQALLAYLAMKPGQPQPRDKIAALLWGDTGEEQARHSLRQTLVGLRKALSGAESILRTESDALSLDPEQIEVDANELQRLASQDKEEVLEKASTLYQGDLLEGLNVNEDPFEEWLLSERERLRELAQEVLARLIGMYGRAKNFEMAAKTANRLLALDPLQEAVHRTLMRVYAQMGRRESALKQYQTCVAVLEKELGMEPDEETKQVYEDILRQGPRKKAEKGAAPLADTDTPVILIVEDDVVTRTLIEGFLSGDQYEILHAGDGADALMQIGKRPLDLVLLDLHMPTLDGLKLLEIMNDKKIMTPVICLTALTGDQVEVRAFELGAADFIRKPIQKEVLLVRVRNVLRSEQRVR